MTRSTAVPQSSQLLIHIIYFYTVLLPWSFAHLGWWTCWSASWLLSRNGCSSSCCRVAVQTQPSPSSSIQVSNCTFCNQGDPKTQAWQSTGDPDLIFSAVLVWKKILLLRFLKYQSNWQFNHYHSYLWTSTEPLIRGGFTNIWEQILV